MTTVRRLSLLMEIQRLSKVLLESRIDFLRKQYVPRIGKMLLNLNIPADIEAAIDAQEVPPPSAGFEDKLFAYVVAADPDRTKKNSQWLLNLLVTGRLPLEDLEKATDYLTRYTEMKRLRLLPPEASDLNRFSSLGALYAAIKNKEEETVAAETSEDQQMMRASTIHYDGPDYLILTPNTEEAAQYFGRPTEWCTAWGDPKGRHPTRSCRYAYYAKNGPLYLVIEKATGNRWQFHIPSRQYMDVDDRSISLPAFFAKHPVVEDVFNRMEGDPVAQIGKLRVFDRNDGLVFKESGGFFAPPVIHIQAVNRVVSRLVIDGRGHYSDSTSYAVMMRMENAGAPREVIVGLLTKFIYTGHAIGLAAQDIFFHNDRWGRLAEVGDVVMRFPDGWAWRGITFPPDESQRTEERALVLVRPDGSTALRGGTTGSKFEVDSTDEKASVVEPYIVPLLLKDDAVETWSTEGAISIRSISVEGAEKLVTAKPGLGDLPTAYRIHGATREILDRIKEHLDDAGVDAEDWTVIDGKTYLIAETFTDGIELAKERGTEHAEWFAKLAASETHIDYHEASELDRSDREKLLKAITNIDPDLLKALGEYLAKTYPDETEEEFDDTFDPSDIDDILTLQEIVEDDDVEDAFKAASFTGAETGAESEAMDIFKNEFDSNRHIYFEKDGSWKRGFEWDTRAAIVVPIKTVMEVIEEVAEGDVDYEGWLKFLEDEYDPREPHYGFTDFDDDAAVERLIEELHSLTAE